MKKGIFITGAICLIAFTALLLFTYIFVAKGREAKELKVGLIMNGTHDDRSLSEVHFDPLYKISKDRGLVLEYFENVPLDESSMDRMVELIEDGCSLIVLDSSFYEDYARTVAIAHPEVNFTCFYGNSYMPNFLTFTGRLYQAHYLTGIVAGLQTDSGNIGFYSQNREPILITGVNAFTLGVKKVNPEAKVFVRFSGTGDDKKDAADFINKRKLDILACDGVSNEPLAAAEESGVWSIGMHFDLSDRYPNTFLTGAALDLTDFYSEQIQRCERGIFLGENDHVGIDGNALDIVPLSEHVKSGVEEEVDAERQLMKDRKKDVFYGPITDINGDVRVNEGESMPDREVLYDLEWFVSGVIIDE